jgi:DNA-binding transcriptional ArsR family regulator
MENGVGKRRRHLVAQTMSGATKAALLIAALSNGDGSSKTAMVALLGRRLNPAKGTSPATVGPLVNETAMRSPQRRLRRLTELEIEELVAARLQGAAIRQLAERFGVNRSTVDRHLRERGVPKRRWQGRTLDAAQVCAAGESYASGVRLELVAAQFGVDRRYLRRVLAEAGFVIRSRGQQKRST